MSLWLLFLVTFPVFLISALCVGFGDAMIVTQQKTQVRRLLRTAERVGEKRKTDLWLEAELSDNLLAHLLAWVEDKLGLKILLMQTGSTTTSQSLIMFSLMFAAGGYLLGSMIPALAMIPLGPLAPALLLMTIPIGFMHLKRKRRMAKFEEQFPEALNFLSRSMRAGHALSIGLEMLLADAPEPLRSIFRPILRTLQLGASLEEALNDLEHVVPLIDVRFFVSAVILQQGTGGNLSEILDTMATIIRDRFRLKGHVKAASAHGRVTGMVLCGMPLVVGLLMFLASPAYIGVLLHDPLGKKLLIGSFALQLVGFIAIKKITDIKV